MNRLFSVVLLIICGASSLMAKELNFTVKVLAPNLQQADPAIFEALEKEIFELFNTNSWTNLEFEDHEKIEANVQLTITKELSETSFEANLVVQSRRPVYNSTYNTPLINYVDKHVAFSYDGLRPLQKTDGPYLDNLSTILSFYAYFILGYDFDTFSPMGGDQFFATCWEIINNLPGGISRSDNGWTVQDNSQQNRYYLIENVQSPRFKAFRMAMYDYHRKGMDIMAKDPVVARGTMLDAVTNIGRTFKENPQSIVIRLFTDTKTSELVDVYRPATSEEKKQVKNVVVSIDPTHNDQFRGFR